MKLDLFPKPTLLGHRGDKSHAPENTLAAFKLAMENGADGVELDTKLTSDGVVVVMHDQTVDRTTNGKGSISKFSSEELRRLDAGSSFSSEFQGERVPTLEEVFEVTGPHGIIDIELTNYASPGDALPVKVAELIKKHQVADRVFISSFHALNLIRFNWLMPDVPSGLLTDVGWAGNLGRAPIARVFPHQLLISYFTDITSELVEREQKQRRKMFSWVEAQPEGIKQLLNMGIDGIITDDPGLARRLMAG